MALHEDKPVKRSILSLAMRAAPAPFALRVPAAGKVVARRVTWLKLPLHRQQHHIPDIKFS